MTKMLNTKFGLVSTTEARCLGELDRWLKKKRKNERKSEQPHLVEKKEISYEKRN